MEEQHRTRLVGRIKEQMDRPGPDWRGRRDPVSGPITGRKPDPRMLFLVDAGKISLCLLCATIFSLAFYASGVHEANIITIYILAVIVIAVATTSPACGFIASVAAVIVFNFFFAEPRFTLWAYDPDYPVTFLVMFVAALLTGSLAARLKNHAMEAAQAAHRTEVLFDTNQQLQRARDRKAIAEITARQLVKLLGRDVVAYSADNGKLGEPRTFTVGDKPIDPACLSLVERAAAEGVLHDGGESCAPNARCLYLAVKTGEHIYGVVGIAIGDEPLDAYDSSILLSILGECALALDNQRNAAEKEAAAVLAKQEQMRANLLRAISHDLRTPLTSISGNASNLMTNGETFDRATKTQMYTDIYDDALWLINLVENLLAVSRIEGDQPQLRMSTELMEEVIEEALNHIDRNSTDYHIRVDSQEEYILVRMDAKLIVQVIINIVNNAIKYTPPGSEIVIGTAKRGDMVEVSIRDNGPGIPEAVKPHIFEMFYSGANRLADSRRSLGLGLALCRSIILAHGGDITVGDNAPHGAVFTFTLPAGEVTLHE